jgi:hypothetical protein
LHKHQKELYLSYNFYLNLPLNHHHLQLFHTYLAQGKMNTIIRRFVLIGAVTFINVNIGISQTAIPEILYKGTLSDQMLFIENRTSIYQDYRAIREDMFQLLKNNSVDSLSKAKSRIKESANINTGLIQEIDSLENILNLTKEELSNMTSTKNAISFLGISLNKNVYNSIMWIIVAALAFLLGTGYLLFKRSFIITRNTKSELTDLQKQFDEYRNKTRLEREKMSMDHFKEVQKLKGK